jgi:O-antigen/teichoic acid export membrane protein
MRFEDKATFNIIAKSSGSILLLVSSIIMVRYFSKEDYGTYLQLMLIMNTAVMLTLVGLPQSILYFYPQVQNKKQLVIQTVLIGLILSILSAILIYLLRFALADVLNNHSLIQYLPIISIAIVLQCFVSFREPFLISNDSLILNSLTTLLASLIIYIPMFTALFLGADIKQIITLFVWCTFAKCVIFFILGFHLIKRKSKESYTLDTSITYKKFSLSEQMRYSFPIGLASYIGVIGRQIDKYMISAFFAPSHFAVYSRGAMEVPLVKDVTYSLNAMTMPQYVTAHKNKDTKKFIQLMHGNMDKIAKLNFGVFAFLFFEAKIVMEILYTKEYVSATPIFQTYLILLLLGITVYGMIPRVTGRTRQLTLATVITVLTNIAVSLSLIPLLGPIGAALGTIIGSICYAAFLLYCATKDLNVSWKFIMPWSNLVSIFLASLYPLILIAFLNISFDFFVFQKNIIFLSFSFFLYFYFYLAALKYLGLLRPEDQSYIKRWFRYNIVYFIPSRIVNK